MATIEENKNVEEGLFDKFKKNKKNQSNKGKKVWYLVDGRNDKKVAGPYDSFDDANAVWSVEANLSRTNAIRLQPRPFYEDLEDLDENKSYKGLTKKVYEAKETCSQDYLRYKKLLQNCKTIDELRKVWNEFRKDYDSEMTPNEEKALSELYKELKEELKDTLKEDKQSSDVDNAILKAYKQLKKNPNLAGVIYAYSQGKDKKILDPVLPKKTSEEIEQFANSFKQGKEARKVVLYVLYPDKLGSIEKRLKDIGLLNENLKEYFTGNDLLRDEDILDILGIEGEQRKVQNTGSYIKQYRQLLDKGYDRPNIEIYLKGDEPYYRNLGKVVDSSRDLVVIDTHLKESTTPVKDLLVKTDNKYGITLDHAIDDIKKKKGYNDSLLGDKLAIQSLMKRFDLEERDVIRALNYKFDGKELKEAKGKLDDALPELKDMINEHKNSIIEYGEALKQGNVKNPNYKDYTTRFVFDVYYFLKGRGFNIYKYIDENDLRDDYLKTLMKKALSECGIKTTLDENINEDKIPASVRKLIDIINGKGNEVELKGNKLIVQNRFSNDGKGTFDVTKEQVRKLKELGYLTEDLDTFDDKMDFLAKDEDEAIDGYKKVIKTIDNKNVKTQLGKIEKEEKAHKDYLEKVKKDKNVKYTEPLMDEE